MKANFRNQEECICCGKIGCNICDCEDLQEEINSEKDLGKQVMGK